MARTPKEPVKIDPKQVGGIKRLRHLLPMLACLHDAGCDRDTAGNRRPHFDEYVGSTSTSTSRSYSWP